MSRFADTIAALATPTGTSAIAVVRLSGPDTVRVAREIFGEVPPPRHLRRADYRDRGGRVLDDVLVVFFQAPQSYTGEDSLEISSHGNPFIAQQIVEDLLARGCRGAEAGEFTQRAFLNGQMDLSQAEAVVDVIHARSERALAAANRQLRGALGRRVGRTVEALLGVLARIEAYIDFPDEDLPAEDRELVDASIVELINDTSKLLSTNRYGGILRSGIKTVIVGKPNVGKSSLLNRLLGSERALVSPEPGTTRDFLEEPIMVGPHYLRLIDTAGLNVSPTPLEKLGMEKTRERLAEADLVLAVVDGSAGAVDADIVGVETDVDKSSAILVVNKSDLAATQHFAPPLNGVRAVFVSAKTGDGILELQNAIVAAADRFRVEVGEDEVAINARHAEALKEATRGLNSALEKVREHAPQELLASDLRSALAAFEQISGRIDNERMLDQLFATFCIGK
jgi:tRNA modification GTPase